ncbi:MAG: CHRD domain-containing protein, partial [Candidatus Omnitrophica bacterium]|nr:CHRD domain-containing protein [Candidatus Omnitrophota bacterium]
MKNMYKIMGLLALAAGIWGCHQTMEPATKPDFTAQLEGGQEVPPVKTDANGEARFFLSPDGRELRYDIVVHK